MVDAIFSTMFKNVVRHFIILSWSDSVVQWFSASDLEYHNKMILGSRLGRSYFSFFESFVLKMKLTVSNCCWYRSKFCRWSDSNPNILLIRSHKQTRFRTTLPFVTSLPKRIFLLFELSQSLRNLPTLKSVTYFTNDPFRGVARNFFRGVFWDSLLKKT